MMLQSSLAHSLNTQYGIPSDPVAVFVTRDRIIAISSGEYCTSHVLVYYSIKLANVIIHFSQNAIFIIW